MLEFKESAASKRILRVVELGQECAIGTIGRYKGSEEYCFRALEISFYAEDLRQIADKLEELNRDRS